MIFLKNVKLCDCVNLEKPRLTPYHWIAHKCQKFDYHDWEHTPSCECCQTIMLTYYTGKAMEKLAVDEKLKGFDEAGLSSARIRE